MPPKKAKQGAAVIDGVDTSEMTREKLEQFTMRVKEELDREREERNFFQLERDKIRTFWEITKTQLEELRTEIRNKEREMEECMEAAEEAAKTHIQQVKHLCLEQQGEKCALQAEAQAALKSAHAHHAAQEAQLLRDKRELVQQLNEGQRAAQEEMRKVKLAHAEELHAVRSEFETRVREISSSAEARLQKSVEELSVANKMDMVEVEQRKNKQLDDLMHKHDQAFTDLKNYYNDITLNNLGLISSLKTQVEETQRSRGRAEKACADAVAEARRLEEPLQAAKEEASELKRRGQRHDRDRAALKSKTKILSALEKHHEALKWDYEILQLRFDEIQTERDELKSNFEKAVLELQQRTALRGAMLEQRLQAKHDKEQYVDCSGDEIGT